MVKRMDERGQYFEGFRLIVEAIMALAILAIIVGAISYFEQLRIDVGVGQLEQGFFDAFEASDGSVIKKSGLEIPQMEISSAYFAKQVNLGLECVEFDSSGISNYSIFPGRHGIKINNLTKTDVFFKCQRDTLGCDSHCTISFGKKLS